MGTPFWFTSITVVLAGLAVGELQAQEAQFLTNGRQLTYEGKRSGEGYFSPDGKALIFQSEREPDNPFYQIYILDLETGDASRVSPGLGKTTCGFFRPGSDQVLFASTHLDPQALQKQKEEMEFRASGGQRRYSWDYDPAMDIFAARRSGKDAQRLTEAAGYDAEGAYSPDGKKIVFCSNRQAYAEPLSETDRKRLETDPAYFADLYLMNADGSGQRQLTRSPGYDGGPFFSPDGKRIVWRRFSEKGDTAEIYSMAAEGGDERQLTRLNALSWAPFYHPSGRYFIFTCNKLGFDNFELFMADSDGVREPIRVTFTSGFDGLPVFSPDGRKLCWTSNRASDGKSQLFMADWNHEAALAALNKPEPASLPATTEAVQKLEKSGAPAAPVGFKPEISVDDSRKHVSYLAADALEGRLTGSDGALWAAQYIASRLAECGVQPFGESYFQEFEFTSGVQVLTNQQRFLIDVPSSLNDGSLTQSFTPERDFRPLSFSPNGEFEGEVVFAGYGLNVPGKAGEGYDSYGGLDVTNKIVLVLRYVPEQVDPKRRQELNRYAGLRYKAMIARERGAKAVLVVTGPNSPNPGSLAPLSSDGSIAGSGILAASVSIKVAETILSAASKDLRALQTGLDTENPHAEGGFAVPKLKVRLRLALERIKKRDRNVIGILPAPSGGLTNEYVLLGAHYDHLGYGDSSSRQSDTQKSEIHNGADDNASGVAAVLEMAAALANIRKESQGSFQRGLMFAFWSGEELGLLGSSHFADKPPAPLTNIAAYINFDMVGRLRENKLNVQGAGSSTIWKRLLEKRNVAAGFNLAIQEDPYLPTDVTALYPKGVPVLNFFTGSHEEYHRPSDDIETLNFPGLEQITKFAAGLTLDLLKETARPDYVRMQSKDTGGSRETLRAYLGTIPDYGTEVNGVKLSGVRAGSPAEKGGLKAGDIIVEFGGQKISNIYDYTYALDAVKIGQPITITVQREDKKLQLPVTPEARK